jgi:hypothetical protein
MTAMKKKNLVKALLLAMPISGLLLMGCLLSTPSIKVVHLKVEDGDISQLPESYTESQDSPFILATDLSPKITLQLSAHSNNGLWGIAYMVQKKDYSDGSWKYVDSGLAWAVKNVNGELVFEKDVDLNQNGEGEPIVLNLDHCSLWDPLRLTVWAYDKDNHRREVVAQYATFGSISVSHQ